MSFHFVGKLLVFALSAAITAGCAGGGFVGGASQTPVTIKSDNPNFPSFLVEVSNDGGCKIFGKVEDQTGSMNTLEIFLHPNGAINTKIINAFPKVNGTDNRTFTLGQRGMLYRGIIFPPAILRNRLDLKQDLQAVGVTILELGPLCSTVPNCSDKAGKTMIKVVAVLRAILTGVNDDVKLAMPTIQLHLRKPHVRPEIF